MEGRISSQHG
jgi:hypothetical protein